MKKFTIENGTNICSIGLSNVGSYIKFKEPLAMVWADNSGSVGKYFCALPYNEDYRTTMRNKINDSLNTDFTDDIEALYDILKPLFPIFRNGDYSLCFYANKEKEFFQYQTSIDNFSNTHFNKLEVLFPRRTTNLLNTEAIKNEHRAFLKENKISKKYYQSNILEYSTDGIYDGWYSFFATQPRENIDQDRVRYFEEKMRNGERPFAIIFNALLESEDFESSYYILDGHHKLLAYQNLGLCPPLTLITHLPNNIDETEFDIEQLKKHLFPWQIKHILEHWEG
ncbi:hypothetical protein DRF65_08455 [Chryseobacterium pennae]|uniref:Uncharacterized protein n=1 Tax=Chryseobacterium pennae TaxID=2258962 RepID=A0A3D9CAD9_9FLAO|nr:hypothetical protein [Chryseobacterium pennae]REC62843.1 hypothetical protein DRF65_08455 [Chryseobacterium pennae]